MSDAGDQTIQVLIVEDDENHAAFIERIFKPQGTRFCLNRGKTIEGTLALISGGDKPDIIISDMLLPDGKGVDLLQNAGSMNIPIVIMTSFGDEHMAVEAIKAGALDYIVKTTDSLSDLPHIVERAYREWQIQEERRKAEETIRASLREKEILLKEIHHRVKNNLQIIASLLEFQSERMPDESSRRFEQDTVNRILAMSQIHELLYQSENFSRVDFSEYIRIIANDLYLSYKGCFGEIKLEIEAASVQLGIDQAIPCGLILNEALSNAFKHAFPMEQRAEGKVMVKFGRLDTGSASSDKDDSPAAGKGPMGIQLSIEDDGIGMPATLSFDDTKNIGLSLISVLSKQLHAKLSVQREGGTSISLRF